MKREFIADSVLKARAAGRMLAEKRKGPRGKSNTRRYEDMGDNDGMQDAVNPKPKFRVSNVEDPKKIKRKAKPKAKDPKRGLKPGEMRGTSAQRKRTLEATKQKRRSSY